MVGEERHHRRDQAQRLDERRPERPERRLVVGVEAPPRAPDVPVGQVVHERVERAHDRGCPVPLVRVGRLGHELLCPRLEPAVEWLQAFGARRTVQVLVPRPEALDVGVGDKERRRVPERQQPPPDLARGPVAEAEVLARHLLAVHEPHHIRAHVLQGLGRVDRVAPRPVHLAPVLVAELLVREDAPVRRPAGEGDGHEALRVEPEPDLLAHLGDPVGGEPLLPVSVVGQVGAGHALRRPGCVAALDPDGVLPAERRERDLLAHLGDQVGGEPLLPVRVVGQVGARDANRRARRVAVLDPLRVLPAERREGHDAGVEPRVADLRDPAQVIGVAAVAADRDLVDPRPVQLLELVEPGRCALPQLRERPDDVQPPARLARVERQRQAEVAAPRDVPVAHVAQPVVHALLVLRRRPRDRVVRVEHRLPDLVGGDEPVVDDAEHERRLAAPADRVAVDDRSLADEHAALA